MSMTENEAIKIIKQENGWESNQRIKDAFSMAIKALEEIQQYKAKLQAFEAIGTIEECQAAVEKMKPKKAIVKKGIPYCPCCEAIALTETGDSFLDYEVNHCDYCGQAIQGKE